MKRFKIFIFNWRDITHPWAGGAELHIHELAKRWVKQGGIMSPCSVHGMKVLRALRNLMEWK